MKSPFKFLDSYSLADRDVFFGRDQEITELYRRVFESKMLLVYGISGTGKSSLVNCGLASQFDESDWLPVNIRRGNNIIDSLNDAFNKQAIRPLKKSLSVSEKLQSIYLDHFKPVYLIFDQFEELFIFGYQEEKEGLIKLIEEITESETQCRILFIIREEFLAGMTEFESELPDIFTNRFRVEKMKRANAISAIEGPCKVYGIETEHGFSEELIDKLCPAGNEIELTYLQIYLDRIFRLACTEHQTPSTEYQGTIKFSQELLTKAGNVSDLLGQFLEEQIREMEDPETGMSILKSFVSVQGTKKQMTEKEIKDSLGAFRTVITEPDLLKYLSRFVDLRILRERDTVGNFELRHDALAGKIYEKFTLSEKELLEVRQFLENAYQSFSARKTYLNHDDLEYLSTYEKRLFFPPVLANFVQESKDKLQSQQKALRRLTSLVALIFLIIVGAGVQFYLNKKGSAATEKLTTLALLQEKVDPLTSINTAFKARQKDSVSNIIQGIILSSFYKLLQDRIEAGDTSLPIELLPRKIPVTGTVLSLKINKSGDHLFGWTDSKEVFTCCIKDMIVRSFKTVDEIEIAEMSVNGKYLAVVYKNSKGDVYKIDGEKLFSFSTNVNHLMNKRLVCFFPSGNYFLAVAEGNRARIYDSTGAGLFYLTGHTGRVNSIDISPDGRFLATASCDKRAIIWNFNHYTKEFSVYNTFTAHKDTVWSCEFNNTGKFVLTASADSMVKIWNLKCEEPYVYFTFLLNSVYGYCAFSPTYDVRLKKKEKHFKYMPQYYQKAYDARFATGHGAIIASNYIYIKKGTGNSENTFRTDVIYWDYARLSKLDKIDKYSLLAQKQSDSLKFMTFKSWDIAVDNRIFAAVSNVQDGILIIAPGGYQLMNCTGDFPEFSKDGGTIYYIDGRCIYSLPVDIKNIRKQVLDKKIFGSPTTGRDIWNIL